MNELNPFISEGYISSDKFCDRENELGLLTKYVKNNHNITLFSDRRIGKTGLIFHFFNFLKTEKVDIEAIYVDIFSSVDLADFVKLLAEAILKNFPEKTSFGKKVMNFFKTMRLAFSYDAITGDPQVQIAYKMEGEKQHTLKSILDYLEAQGKIIVIAIDEFQQITEYPEKNIEALLRTYIQQYRNLRFIFSGSKTSIMTEIFANAKRPFFASTTFMHIDKIDEHIYFDFIKHHFERNKRIIDDESILFILNWTLRHTFYTQYLCNQVFADSKKKITIDLVKAVCAKILQREEAIFAQYRQLLTPAQWNYLIAVAKEEEVKQLTAQNFIAKYKIGTPANSKRIATSLINKDLLLAKPNSSDTMYRVYDVFFMRWLQMKY